jgi:hypothetical protein
VAFYTALAVGFLGLLVFAGYTVNLIQGLFQGNNVPVVWLGFIVGILLGIKLGLVALSVAHALALSLRSLRTERLLLRYHDALADLAKVHADAEIIPCAVAR